MTKLKKHTYVHWIRKTQSLHGRWVLGLVIGGLVSTRIGHWWPCFQSGHYMFSCTAILGLRLKQLPRLWWSMSWFDRGALGSMVYFGGVVWWPYCVDHLRYIMLEAGGLTGNLEHWQANCVLRPNSIHNDEINKKVRFSKWSSHTNAIQLKSWCYLAAFSGFTLGM